MSKPREQVALTLRDSDRDRYLSTLVLPAGARGPATALYAFNVEIASVSDRVRDPAAGEIRLRWWADVLEGQRGGEGRANPVADALLQAIEQFHLPVAALERLIEARRFDLYQDVMFDIAGFEGYAGETASVLYQLAAMMLNGGQPVQHGDAAGHVGVAHALIGHLRAFGYNANRGRIFLPWQIFATCGVVEGDIFAGKSSPGLAIALTRIAELAAEHLHKGESAIAALPRTLRPAFAHIAILSHQLARISFETPFQSQPDLSDWQKIARLAWWRMRNG